MPMRARLVERLGLSAAAVSETVGRLVDEGFVELARRPPPAASPPRAAGSRPPIVRRHRLAERLLVDVIGLEWEKVHAEAARWEHAISADVEEKLVLLLGDPATCPHGNPIPGSQRSQSASPHRSRSPTPTVGPDHRRARQRTARDVGRRARAHRRRAPACPGCDATVIDANADGVTVKTDTGEHRVPTRVAESLYVSVALTHAALESPDAVRQRREVCERALFAQREAEASRDRLRRGVLRAGSRCRARRRRGARTRTRRAPRRLRSRSPCPSGRDAASSRSRCRASRRARASAYPRVRRTRRTPSPPAPTARCRATPTGRAAAPCPTRPRSDRRRRADATTRAPRGVCSTAVYASTSSSRNGRSISRSVSTVGQAPTAQPPATAGTMLIVWPSVTGESTPCRKRMSSSARNTLTKRRSPPVSSNSRSAKPGCAASSAFSASATVPRLDLHLGRVRRRGCAAAWESGR